jgi:hypothetical protein
MTTASQKWRRLTYKRTHSVVGSHSTPASLTTDKKPSLKSRLLEAYRRPVRVPLRQNHGTQRQAARCLKPDLAGFDFGEGALVF